MRLELTRRLTHAPQTCLSTYSSTLAYAPSSAKAIIAEKRNLSTAFFSFLDSAPAELFYEQTREPAHRKDQHHGAVVHRVQIAHLEIGVVAEQGRVFTADRDRREPQLRTHEHERHHVRAEEVPVVHVRQEKRHGDAHQHRAQQQRAVVHALPEIPDHHRQQREHERRCENADGGGCLRVRNRTEQGEDGRGVVVQARADAASLLQTDRERIPEPAPGEHSREHEKHIHRGSKETNFENCLADVNIPLGEVFTSPKLKGTNGLLHVSSVYLKGLNFKELEIEFEDGMIKDYRCQNFDSDEENKNYFKENVMFNHETLPIGEFAIGTNTTAYVIANKYDCIYKLPILIVEKMGPHFAVGDTCFSFQEDMETFNPDGKQIVARENEVSALRKTDISKAYFGCHTDVTIPYDELGDIVAITKDGDEIKIIEQGRFVLEGTELLNEALNEA